MATHTQIHQSICRGGLGLWSHRTQAHSYRRLAGAGRAATSKPLRAVVTASSWCTSAAFFLRPDGGNGAAGAALDRFLLPAAAAEVAPVSVNASSTTPTAVSDRPLLLPLRGRCDPTIASAVDSDNPTADAPILALTDGFTDGVVVALRSSPRADVIAPPLLVGPPAAMTARKNGSSAANSRLCAQPQYAPYRSRNSAPTLSYTAGVRLFDDCTTTQCHTSTTSPEMKRRLAHTDTSKNHTHR